MISNKSKNITGLTMAKKERENTKQLVNRFMRHLRRSGILRQAKRSAYRKRPASQKLRTRAALRREELKRQYEKAEKMGKV